MKTARLTRVTAPAACPMATLLQILMGPWTTYILWVLRREGPRRFGELKRAIPGISAKVLTERLRRLEGERVITRSYKATIPPQVTYALADRGDELARVLDSLNEVATRWRAEAQSSDATASATAPRRSVEPDRPASTPTANRTRRRGAAPSGSDRARRPAPVP